MALIGSVGGVVIFVITTIFEKCVWPDPTHGTTGLEPGGIISAGLLKLQAAGFNSATPRGTEKRAHQT